MFWTGDMRLLASHSVTKLTVLSALSACAVAMPRFVAPPHDRSCVTKCKILCNFPYRIRHNQHIYSNRERCRADNGETQTIYWSGRRMHIIYKIHSYIQFPRWQREESAAFAENRRTQSRERQIRIFHPQSFCSAARRNGFTRIVYTQ